MKRKAAEEVEEGEKQNMWNNGKHWVRGELLGQGSFGSVYLATAKKPRSCNLYGGRQYPQVMAVKSAEMAAAESIQHEGNVLFAIKGSPFVIERLGEEVTHTEDGKWVYNLLLEYASGGTLDGLIKSYNGCGMPESEVGQHTKSILEGIRHIHNCGYVHCDLKPENILLVPNASGNLVAKVADLGLAKSSDEELNGWRGTRLYTDPEALIYGMQNQLSDIWSIGCIVLEMLTGNDPWNMEPDFDVEEFMNVVVNEQTPKIPEEVSDVARDFLKSCLASEPWERLTAEKLLLHPFVSQSEALQVDDAGVTKPRRVSRIKKGRQPQALEVITISDDDGQFLEPSVIEVITISDDDQKPVVTKRRRVAKDKKGYLAEFQPARAPLTALVAQ